MMQGPTRRLLSLVTGFLWWAGAFLTLYAVNALGCAFAWPPTFQRTVLLVLSLSYLTALVGLTWRRWRQRQAEEFDFVASVGYGTAAAALAATACTLAPAVALTLCR
jgi:hypothetical protein